MSNRALCAVIVLRIFVTCSRGRIDDMSTDQEQGLRILDNALWRIAHRGDCEYDGEDQDGRSSPCECPRCVAISALKAAKNWRFLGAFWERTQHGHWPRETKMHAAWMKLITSSGGSPDRLLSQVLGEDQAPSARDWYVATSVVQWLATNVGMTVLEAAGFSYKQWDQDRADGELFRRRQEQDRAEAALSRRRQEQEQDRAEAAFEAALSRRRQEQAQESGDGQIRRDCPASPDPGQGSPDPGQGTLLPP
jgi:hypothetical protein